MSPRNLRKLDGKYHARCYDLAAQMRPVCEPMADVFSNMLEAFGGVSATKILVIGRPSRLFGEMAKKNRVDLTVEAIITTEREWDPLFDDEDRETARQHLEEFGWSPDDA